MHQSAPVHSDSCLQCSSNRMIGWISLTVGAGTGLVLGLWSFSGPVPVPEWLGEYNDVSRRLARLGHIAFFGLGILNILLAASLPRTVLSRGQFRTAQVAMNFGNIGLPTSLFAAAIYHPLKYLMPFPATAVFVAMSLAALGVLRYERQLRRSDQAE